MKWNPGSVVFEKDDWVLVQQRKAELGIRRMHRHDDGMFTIHLIETKCASCGTEVPDEIQGLWMIANWSRLYG